MSLCFIVAVLNSLIAGDEQFTTSKSESQPILFSWEWATEFVENRQFLVASLQVWPKFLNFSSQQQRKEDFGGQHRTHPRWKSCTPKNGSGENLTSQLLPYHPGLVGGWFLFWCQENQSMPCFSKGCSWCPPCLGFQRTAECIRQCRLCKAVHRRGKRKTSLTLAGDQFTNSSMRFNYPFHYLSLHSSECEPSMNQRNSHQLLLWERGR